jgi:hypothetical protein
MKSCRPTQSLPAEQEINLRQKRRRVVLVSVEENIKGRQINAGF